MPICVAFQNDQDVSGFLGLAEELGLRSRSWDHPQQVGVAIAEIIVPAARLVEFVALAEAREVRIDGLDASTKQQVLFAHHHDIPALVVIKGDDPKWGDGPIKDDKDADLGVDKQFDQNLWE